MRLTARSEYGLLALIDLACHADEGPVSVRGMAERQRIPQKFLEQLFGSLRKGGLVSAVRGARGGFVLGRDPGDITVLDVVELLEGPLQPTQCGGDAPCHRSPGCAASAVWSKATVALRDVLVNTTLAQLAGVQVELDNRGAAAGPEAATA